MKTIMLCLNQLGIGGVETAVLNQTIQLIKRGYRVLILAKDGIYRHKFEEKEAIFVQTEFIVQNKYDLEKIKEIMKIMEEYQVEQVHIHQFDCINTVVPACLLRNIPYVAYTHTGITGTYDWFENSYLGYDKMFKLYFENAEKIIAITEQAKIESMEKYNISAEKYLVIRNSIDFENFKVENNEIPNKLEKFLIISRLAHEKLVSLKNSILLFKNIYQKNKKAKLTIVGGGECQEEIEKEIEEIKEAVSMLGEKSNIAEIIADNDVIIALDRCILETVAMKRIAIISGYKEMKGIVTPGKIEQIANSNFSGEGNEGVDIEEITKELEALNENQIKTIVEENYQYALKNLNASKNLYVIQDNEKRPKISNQNAINMIMELQNLYANKIEYADNLYKESKEAQKWLEGIIEEKDKEIEEKNKEIEKLKEQIEKKNQEIEEYRNQGIRGILRKLKRGKLKKY